MSDKGFSHIGLSTLDLDRTRDFYENVLKFKAVRCDILKIKEGGQVRHIFFDTGRDQLLAFMEARGVPGVSAQYDAGINRGLGVPIAFYHVAVEAGSLAALEEKRNELIARGVEVTEVVDHDWAKSIYFKDPEHNIVEVYLDTPYYVHQPHGDSLDLDRPDHEIWRETEEICRKDPSFMLKKDFEAKLAKQLSER